MSKGTCFVIQPFVEPFNKRYDDVYAPAIRAAGLEPYRVDQDLTADVLIERIRSGIDDARICLADISIDRPNVFYELGAAHMIEKDVVMLCDQSMRPDKLPFDIAHRNVLMYTTQSKSDFEKLTAALTAKLKAMVERSQDIRKRRNQPLAEVDGLDPMELALLVIVAEQDSAPSYFVIVKSMERLLFAPIAARLGMERLRELAFVAEVQVDDRDGPFTGYVATTAGLQWLRRNVDKIKLRRDEPKAASSQAGSAADDEPPF